MLHWESKAMDRHSNLLGIFAKQPAAGQVKTRLAQATSVEWAGRVAEALLGDTLDRFSAVAGHRAVVFAPVEAAAYFAELTRGRFELIVQADGDLGDRLRHFFTATRQRGFANVIAVGADSPTLPTEYIEQAFRLLAKHDVVIGPAFDGGYYLIGASAALSLFDAIPWSTAGVLEATVERVRSASASLALLPPWYDVDGLDDWALLRGHVLAMRQAEIDPGVPRLEELMREESATGLSH
jgi:rSAM/selenodomain-associated transferase 1